jgi:hypothetical protein
VVFIDSNLVATLVISVATFIVALLGLVLKIIELTRR